MSIFSDPTTSALELAARFAEERQKVLAENVANIDTPGYASKHLDPLAFQASLRQAIQRAEQPPDCRTVNDLSPLSRALETGWPSVGQSRTGGSDADSPDPLLYSGNALNLRNNAQFSTTLDGGISVKPEIEPADNLLFHDGTNAGIEKLMSDAAENDLNYQLATNLLHSQYDLLLTAIRGRI